MAKRRRLPRSRSRAAATSRWAPSDPLWQWRVVACGPVVWQIRMPWLHGEVIIGSIFGP